MYLLLFLWLYSSWTIPQLQYISIHFYQYIVFLNNNYIILFQIQSENQLAELNVIHTLPELVPILTKPEPIHSDKKTHLPIITKTEPEDHSIDNYNLSSTMSHASRRRHDSDNDPPAE